MKPYDFTKGIEKLIDPIEVGTIHFMYPYSKLLPKKMQNIIVESSAKKNPYMGFVVEPYSYFLCYELKDLAWAEQLIPDNFRLVQSKIFADDEPKYYCIFGCFNVHTSAFWGQRMEFYIVAEDKTTGLLTWIIVDYDSNTISYDKKGGLVAPNCKNAIITTDFNGTVIVDMVPHDESRQMVFESNITNGKMQALDQRLWIEGNFSIGYGREIAENSAEVFGLRFNPLEVEQALNIPIEHLQMEANSWFPDLFEEVPAQIACFPYAQHFLSDSPGHSSDIKSKEQLVASLETLNMDEVEVYSTQSMKKMFMLGSIIPIIISLILLILLIIK